MAQYPPHKNQQSLDEMPDSEAWKLGYGGKRAGAGKKRVLSKQRSLECP